MGNATKRILSLLLMLAILLTGLPSEIKIFAAPIDISLSVEYNYMSQKYEISFPSAVEPLRTEVSYHNPDGTVTLLNDTEVYINGRVVVSTTFEPDHIYDITMKVFRPGDGALSHEGKVYYLADITFVGESFNEMAKMADIEDKNPTLIPNVTGSAVTVRSGDNPSIKLSWKIPTFYSELLEDESVDPITYLTTYNKAVLNELADPMVPISKASFQIGMTVGHGSTKTLTFNTDISGDDMIVENTNVKVSGIDAGVPTTSDRMVSVILTKEEGIEPGTEYEFTNIGIIFENDLSEQVPLRRTKMRADSDNRFYVRNIDNAFSDLGSEISSIFTPIQIELTKVDTDKIEVRFKKIVNGVYPELFYQVQYATRIDDFYTQTSKWVKIPASSLPANEEYGSEIVTINIPGTTNPEYYFRVVYFDSSSVYPKSSSLAVDLRLLGLDTGRPSLPKEIKTEAIYAGRRTVTVPTTELSSGQVEIPGNDLRISFEKPLQWRFVEDWETFKAQPYTDSDFAFHVILSTYLPDTKIDKQTRTIGLSQTKDVYMPVKQKRVLVLGKKNFVEDPADKNRVIVNIPGDQLFYDYVTNSSIENENNEDPSEDGTKGDYPTFLLPNTTYYMQIFTSRHEDIDDIYNDLWGDSQGLSEEINARLSYKSPIISFTTWPLTEMPVPMPDIQLSIDPATYVDPVSGNITLSGIAVKYPRVLTDVEWNRYTSATTGRAINYEIFISRSASEFSETPIAVDTANYPEAAEVLLRGVTITADDNGNPILPNTTYYVKARSSLVVEGVVIGRSVDTAVKAITTPKIDTGGLDNVAREPRSPSEFSIATDAEGQLLLGDSWVTLSWLHAENDVTYDMIVTSTNITPQAVSDDYANDPYNMGLLIAYNELRQPAGDSKLHLDVNSAVLKNIGLTVDENNRVLLPIRRDYLRPNRIYYFSLRAVRMGTDASGNPIEIASRWITIPVTTRMVQAPAFIETVKDLEVGFNIQSTANGTSADSMEVYLKKSGTDDSQYVQLIRSQYTCVRDGTTFYFRIYNLESNQWYDIRVKNKADNRWYNGGSGTWAASAGEPIKIKTRDAMREIEVRWEGQDPYAWASQGQNNYFLEVRSENDTDYEKLTYNSNGFTDYGYDLLSGGRIMFYREKTNLYVEEGSPKYIYYARITGKPIREANGSLTKAALKSNTTYYVKVWAFSQEESLHVGPAIARTDFSQVDYDDKQKEDDTTDLFDKAADALSQKLYWLVDIKAGTTLRAILKDDKITGLLKAAREATVTVDLSAEQANTSYYEILVPYKTLETIETTGSRLNLKLLGTEITLNKGSIDLSALKAQALTNGAKEAMVLLKIERRQSPKSTLPSGFTAVSKIYDVQAVYFGSRMTYQEISGMIYNILKKPDATGPFKYGILNRELTKVLKNLESYSYRTHTDLKDLIKSVISGVEVELSKYLKDIMDGGSGLPVLARVNKAVSDFPGKIGVMIEYTYGNGYITPFVKYGGTNGSDWKEPAGSKAYYMQYALFRVEKPGEYVVVGKGQTTVLPGTPADSSLSKLAAKYDLTKVFGKGTINPSNPVTGEQAVMLFAVVNHRDNEITGMTPAQKATKLGLGDIITARQLGGYIDQQTSVSLAVKVYCTKANINAANMKPSKTITITNSKDISTKLYPYVVLGVDLNITTLENYRFDAAARTTTGKLLDMISKVLEKFE